MMMETNEELYGIRLSLLKLIAKVPGKFFQW